LPSRSHILIGNESLLVHCGSALLDAGDSVAAVVTEVPEIVSWAESRQLRRFSNVDELGNAPELPFDFILSIGNLKIIPPAVLQRASIGGINFHDGPLPELGGLNTPAWAIMRGHAEHGITWHWMTGAVDAGAIIAQRRFRIAPDETALTLNARCFDAAISTLPDVIATIRSGPYPTNQTGVTPREVIRGVARPVAAGALDWRRPAAELSALVRGLDYGQYANPLCLPKALIGGASLAVPQLLVLERSSGATPGTLLAVADDGLTVATGSQDVRITKFRTLAGEALSAREAALRFNLREGDILGLPESLAASVSAIDARVVPHEGWWIRHLAHCEPGTLPFPERGPAADGEMASVPLDLSALPIVPGHAPADVALALITGLLARLRGRAEFSVTYEEPALRGLTQEVKGWYASAVPARLSVPFEGGLDALVEMVGRDLSALRNRLTYPLDLILRQPTLRHMPAAMPIALVVAAEPELVAPRMESDVTFVVSEDGSRGRLQYNTARLTTEQAASLSDRLALLARGFRKARNLPLGQQPLLADDERRRMVRDWNATGTPVDTGRSIDELVHERATMHPEQVALVCRGRSLTYRELDEQVSRMAHLLQARGIGPDDRVAVLLDRELELVVTLLAVLRAGGAYVPLDPEYPPQRLALMLEDSGARLVVTQESRRGSARDATCDVVTLEGMASELRELPYTLPARAAGAGHLAYVIYTSGSTGRPKGVMVEHGNVLNFFAAMDQRLGTTPGTWLAVTSVSFDISVLELFWTLTRGYTVVLHREGRSLPRAEQTCGHPSFSLFYFASAESGGSDQYRLLLDGARFADARGFEAVWTPERHFHAFGGIYPNPAVTGAAVAAVTHRVHVRGGSVVLPLHHPARVAEEWAVVDSISGGRAGVAFAAGWQPNDFVLRPEAYADHKAVMTRDIEVVRRLWRGEAVELPGVNGRMVPVRTLPRPVQPELPIWLTAAGRPETYRQAGLIGARVLTHLLGQSIEELGAKLALYRQAWREAGHQGEGRVTLMLHTLIGRDEAEVKALVRQPLIEYLRSSVDLIKGYAWSFPALKRRPGDEASGGVLDLDQLSEQERESVLEYAFERYYETSGLFGTVDSCTARVDRLAAIGVDEIACLIDFGVPTNVTLAHLEHLDQLRQRASLDRPAAADQHGLAALVARHGVTHLQCTPSLARLLLADAGSRAALGALRHMLVGGELLSEPLAVDLRGALPAGRLHNMYGPTETTVWSTMHDVAADERPVPIGRPIANTQVYVLDARGELLPVGIPGELHIGGLGVTRGYLGQAEATANRFVPDPFQAPGGRMYRTGDRVRWRADGRLEFLGRLDQQVKLTGYRIELGDVEAHCEAHPDVRTAVVMAREDRPGETRLVAYVVFRAGAADTAGLRAHLRRALPDFMVPSHIVALDRLPMTPNGKVDRRALPDPSIITAATPSIESRPANVIEETIAGIWRDLLQLPHVSRDANFFDLGGHSLLAVQVHRRLRELLPERPVGITDLFRFPTIAALAEFLGGGDSGEARLGDSAARGEARRNLQRRTRRAGGEGA